MITNGTVLQKVSPNDEYIGVEKVLHEYFTEISGLSPLTLRVRRWDISLFLKFLEKHGSLDLKTWLPLDTARFRAEMIRESYAPNTVNRVLSSLRNLAKWGTGKHWPRDPSAGVSDLQLPLPVPKALSEADFYRITKAAEILTHRPRRKYDESRRNKALIALLASSGLRITEVLNLKIQNLQRRKLVGVLTKRSKIRDVLLSKEAAEIVHGYIREGRTAGSDFLFTSRYGGRLSRNGAAFAIEKLAHLGGATGEHITPHAFRHRLGKRVRQLAGDVAAARKLGHSGTRLVELYATTSIAEDEALADAV